MNKYNCDKCGKEFAQKSHYTQHINKKNPCVYEENIEKMIEKKVDEKVEAKLEEKIQKVSPDFIIVTNEHNPQMSFTPSKIPNLILEKEFKEVVNSRSFFTQIIRVNSE